MLKSVRWPIAVNFCVIWSLMESCLVGNHTTSSFVHWYKTITWELIVTFCGSHHDIVYSPKFTSYIRMDYTVFLCFLRNFIFRPHLKKKDILKILFNLAAICVCPNIRSLVLLCCSWFRHISFSLIVFLLIKLYFFSRLNFFLFCLVSAFYNWLYGMGFTPGWRP